MATEFDATQGELWIGKQSAWGTPATTPDLKVNLQSGGIQTKKEVERVKIMTGTRLPKRFSFTKSMTGEGELVALGTATDLGHLLFAILGTDTFTAADAGVSPAEHVITTREAGAHPLTIWEVVGEGASRKREIHEDCIISELSIEHSAANPELRVTANVMSLTSGKVLATADIPTVDMSALDPFIHFQGEGTYEIDGTALPVEQVKVTIKADVNARQADSARPYAFSEGDLEVMVTFTVTLDSDTTPLYNQVFYGTSTPADDDLPTSDIYAGSFEYVLSNGLTGEDEVSVAISCPHVEVDAEVVRVANVEEKDVKMGLSGIAEATDSDEAFTATVRSTDPLDAAAY